MILADRCDPDPICGPPKTAPRTDAGFHVPFRTPRTAVPPWRPPLHRLGDQETICIVIGTPPCVCQRSPPADGHGTRPPPPATPGRCTLSVRAGRMLRLPSRPSCVLVQRQRPRPATHPPGDSWPPLSATPAGHSASPWMTLPSSHPLPACADQPFIQNSTRSSR